MTNLNNHHQTFSDRISREYGHIDKQSGNENSFYEKQQYLSTDKNRQIEQVMLSDKVEYGDTESDESGMEEFDPDDIAEMVETADEIIE